jgi:hypothetical protein
MRTFIQQSLAGPDRAFAVTAELPRGRFDDLRAGRSLAFAASAGEVVAMRSELNRPVLPLSEKSGLLDQPLGAITCRA